MKSRALSAAYLERKLRAITSVQGDNPLPELADLQGLLVLENDRPEWGFPGGELRSAFATSSAAGGAANASVVGLFNPVGSGLIAIVERLWGDTDPGTPVNGTSIEVAWSLAFSGGAQRVPREGRESTALVSGGVGVVSANTLSPAGLSLTTLDVFTPRQEYLMPIVVPEGVAVVMLGLDAVFARRLNLRFSGGIAWRTRALEGKVELK